MPYFYYGLIFLMVGIVIAALKADYNVRLYLLAFVIVGMFVFLTRKKRR